MKTLDTQLKDRVLRFDGVSVVSPEMVAELLLLGAQPHEVRVAGNSWEVEQFNLHTNEQLLPPGDPIKLDMSWQLPKEYLDIDLDDYVINKAAPIIESAGYGEAQHMVALHRVVAELAEIKRRGMGTFVKTIIYVLDTFKKTGTVWGVGRGSSCASYVLFILGLHSVDCVRLNVPMDEFYHD
mgnify:CR=1 FL=1